MAFLKKRGDTWYLYWTADGKKRGRSLKTNRKTLAQQYLTEFGLRLAQRELGQTVDVSLDRLSEEYLSYSKATKKQSTLDRHDRPRVTRFVEFLKGQRLQKPGDIRTSHIQAYQQKLLESLKPVTVRHCMFSASGLLGFALQRGYVLSNVARNVAKVNAEKNPPRYLTFDEWERVKEVARQTYLWPLVATAYYTGFRNSELRFLTWPEIDFDRNVITLVNKEGFTLKNRQSRTVPLHKDLKEVLLPLRRDSGYCFLDSHGHQFGNRELSVEFRKLVVRPSGLPHFSLHTLRHTFASHLVMKGMDIYRVSQWLGHRSVSTTMIYAHLAPQDDKINVL
jgi:integrase